MLEIKDLKYIKGNTTTIYAINNLLEKGLYPKFSILSGRMGVGKSTAARIIADKLNSTDTPAVLFNFGVEFNISDLDVVYTMSPAKPKAFIFEEMHGLDKSQQTALLALIDKQPDNVYVIATTTELYKILPTIRSRATIWDFKLLNEKQLTQLMNEYLEYKGISLTTKTKNILLRTCYGVPRDLLKNIDLVSNGDFTDEHVSELFDSLSDDLVFTLLISLKSNTTDFAVSVNSLLDNVSRDKLIQLRDFYIRVILEGASIGVHTLDKEQRDLLLSTYTKVELKQLGETLLHATPDTLVLELIVLNMKFTGVGGKALIGQQRDRIAQNVPMSYAVDSEMNVGNRINNATIDRNSLKDLKFD